MATHGNPFPPKVAVMHTHSTLPTCTKPLLLYSVWYGFTKMMYVPPPAAAQAWFQGHFCVDEPCRRGAGGADRR
jgi:hypothetical protein